MRACGHLFIYYHLRVRAVRFGMPPAPTTSHINRLDSVACCIKITRSETIIIEIQVKSVFRCFSNPLNSHNTRFMKTLDLLFLCVCFSRPLSVATGISFKCAHCFGTQFFLEVCPSTRHTWTDWLARMSLVVERASELATEFFSIGRWHDNWRLNSTKCYKNEVTAEALFAL